MQRNPCVQMTWVHPPISRSSTFPKGRDSLLRCLFCLFNFLTMHHSLRRCAQVLSLPRCFQTWLPLRAFLNDKAAGPKLWYVGRKPKLTVGGGRKRKALPVPPSSQMSSFPCPGCPGNPDEETSGHLKVSDRCHGRRRWEARSDGAWRDSGRVIEAGSGTCRVWCMSTPILVTLLLHSGNYKRTDRASGKCSENLQTSFPDQVMLPSRSNVGSAAPSGYTPAG